MPSREEAREAVRTLVERFREHQADYTRAGSTYNETELRNDFLNPFLQALGWDVLNEKQAPQHLREVVHEDTIEIDDESGKLWKKPDYAMRAVELEGFQRLAPNTYIIFPYKIADEKAVLYTPAEMQANFPLCWAYLCAHKDQLEKRALQGKTADNWYRFGRNQSLTQFDNQPKLIWPVLSIEPRYAYDDQNIVFTAGGNGPYYALRPLPTSTAVRSLGFGQARPRSLR